MDNEFLQDRSSAKKRKFEVVIVTLLLILAASVSAFLYVKYQRAVSANPNEERQKIVNSIGNAITLPNEEPALSTVQDKTKLTNPTLKERAENGDKLLIYAKAKRLVIYRPSTSKVIDILTIQDKQPVTAGTATETPVQTESSRQ